MSLYKNIFRNFLNEILVMVEGKVKNMVNESVLKFLRNIMLFNEKVKDEGRLKFLVK